MSVNVEQVKRWRLILGASSQEKLGNCCSDMELSSEQMDMDQALAAIYDETEGSSESRGKRAPASADPLQTCKMARRHPYLLQRRCRLYHSARCDREEGTQTTFVRT